MMEQYNLRSLAAQTIEQVIENRKSLSDVFPLSQQRVIDKDKALIKELCFGVLRTFSQMKWLLNKLMSRSMTGKNRIIHYLIMVGFYQLIYTRIPPRAVLFETVEGAVAVKCPKLKGLVNGILRQFQHQQKLLINEFLTSNDRYLHPRWLLKRLQKAYPQQWEEIIEANNQRPPMWLRINRNYHSREEWLSLLKKTGIEGFPHCNYPDAVRLIKPIMIQILPGFEKGWITVQDISAQDCITWLNPKNGDRILDLCAAPGVKTTHILEVAPNAKVLSVDIDVQRLSLIYENLNRLGIKAEVRQGDARVPKQWCKEKFDKILIDAPCSSTGVIRRHPDIKWLRKDRDIKNLVQLQSEILDAIWPYLKPGGTLVYATCSVLPDENSQQVAAFLRRTSDATLHMTGTPNKLGKQNLPRIKEGDGFFYAKLIKS